MTTSRANEAIREIAKLQKELAEFLDNAAAKAEAMNAAISRKADELHAAIKRDRRCIAEAAAALAAERVNTGELSSRLNDEFKARGYEVYPTPYEPIAANHCITWNYR